jgi:hypothetical protein
MAEGPPGGAVLLARAMQDSEVWAMPERFVKLWVYLLLNVRWDKKPHRIGPVTVRYGQVVKSYRKIAEENWWVENQRERQWSTSTVKRMLEWFEGEKMIKTLGTDLGTLITVLQFEKYQDFATYAAGNLGTDPGTPAEHLPNNRKQDKPEEANASSNWVGRCVDLWQEKAGKANAGRIGKALKPMHAEYGADTVAAVLDFYLDNEEAEFLKVERFAETFVAWGKKAKEARNGKTGNSGRRGAAQPRSWDYDNATTEWTGFNEPDTRDPGKVPRRDH